MSMLIDKELEAYGLQLVPGGVLLDIERRPSLEERLAKARRFGTPLEVAFPGLRLSEGAGLAEVRHALDRTKWHVCGAVAHQIRAAAPWRRRRLAQALRVPRVGRGPGCRVRTDQQDHWGIAPRWLVAIDRHHGIRVLERVLRRLEEVPSTPGWRSAGVCAAMILARIPGDRGGSGMPRIRRSMALWSACCGLGWAAERCTLSVLRGFHRLPAGGIGRIAVRIAAAAATKYTRADWGDVRAAWSAAERIARYRAGWERLGVPAFRAAGMSEDSLGALCALVANGVTWNGVLGRRIRVRLREDAEGVSETALRRIADAPTAYLAFAELAEMAADAGLGLRDRAWTESALQLLGAAGLKPPESAWLSGHALFEWADSQGVSLFNGSARITASADQRARYRAQDRLARRNPAYARRAYPAEYARGERLASLYARILGALRVIPGPIVVHGRDGEAILRVAERIAPDVARRSRFVLTSRPLTTHRIAPDPVHMAALRRIAPPATPATHVDTGFAGSCPFWMERRGWRVTSVRLVSTPMLDCALLGEESTVPELRAVVLSDLEHCAQRLEEATPETQWGSWPYSPHAAGFWARVAGICDSLEGPSR